MGSFNIFHWLVLFIIWFAFLWPMARILTRTGHSGLWVLLAFLPLINCVALWVFAYKKWPSEN